MASYPGRLQAAVPPSGLSLYSATKRWLSTMTLSNFSTLTTDLALRDPGAQFSWHPESTVVSLTVNSLSRYSKPFLLLPTFLSSPIVQHVAQNKFQHSTSPFISTVMWGSRDNHIVFFMWEIIFCLINYTQPTAENTWLTIALVLLCIVLYYSRCKPVNQFYKNRLLTSWLIFSS